MQMKREMSKHHCFFFKDLKNLADTKDTHTHTTKALGFFVSSRMESEGPSEEIPQRAERGSAKDRFFDIVIQVCRKWARRPSNDKGVLDEALLLSALKERLHSVSDDQSIDDCIVLSVITATKYSCVPMLHVLFSLINNDRSRLNRLLVGYEMKTRRNDQDNHASNQNNVLFLAATRLHPPLLKFFLDLDLQLFDVLSRQPQTGNSIFHKLMIDPHPQPAGNQSEAEAFTECIELICRQREEAKEMLIEKNRRGETALICAARQGRKHSARVLIAEIFRHFPQGRVIEHLAETDALGWTALHHATAAGNKGVVKTLVKLFSKEAISVDFRDKAQETPLMIACRPANSYYVQSTFSSKSNTDGECQMQEQILSQRPNFPLHHCLESVAERRQIRCAQLLLEANADPNLKNSVGMGCVHFPWNHAGFLKLLKESSATDFSATALHFGLGQELQPIDFAIVAGAMERVLFLHQDLDQPFSEQSFKLVHQATGNNFLQQSCSKLSCVGMISKLLQSVAPQTIVEALVNQNQQGDTAWHLSAREDMHEVISLMSQKLSHRVLREALSIRNQQGQTAVGVAMAGRSLFSLGEFLKILSTDEHSQTTVLSAELVCDLRALRDEDGKNLLQRAAQIGAHVLIERLLSARVEGGNGEAFRLFDVDQGFVDPEGFIDDGTALHLACSSGHSECCALLIEKGKADINSRQSRNSDTPLHRAASSGCEDVVRQLVSQAAILLDARNEEGETPLSISQTSNQMKVFELISRAVKARK